jgi:hypothetical protein
MNLLIFSSQDPERASHRNIGTEIQDAFFQPFDYPFTVLLLIFIAVIGITLWLKWLIAREKEDRNERANRVDPGPGLGSEKRKDD